MAALTTDTPGSGDEVEGAAPVQYPLEVEYCEICTMPPEVGVIYLLALALAMLSTY